MKRGGLVFVALILAAGIFRFGGPTGLGPFQGGVPSTPSDHSEGSKKPQEQRLEDKLLQGAAYDQRLKSTIQSFFGSECEEKSCEDLDKHWNVPNNMRGNARFLIAIFPDPKHTRLGLFLDRGIEAVQRAAQAEGFDFDRAILPWNPRELPESKDFFSLLLQAKMESDSEKYPGLLIFREGWDRAGKQDQSKKCDKHPPAGNKPLFVFVVSEKPTGGIDKEQFGKTLDILREIRGGQKASSEPLFILGPTSSGSFYSLKEAFEINSKRLPSEVFLYSGIARAAPARDWFMKYKPGNVRYLSFLENDKDILLRFDDFAKKSLKITDGREIAVLSEDETSYGRWSRFEDNAEQDPRSLWFYLQFPRGISQFRSAYQREFGSANPVPEIAVPGRPVLRLDLEPHGEDDSVPTFARGQMPLSQEAVMIQIVSALRQATPRPKLVILRATDPLDGLFLARYLRTHYPEGRIVVLEPDLLLARDQDGLLTGTIAISNYPLALREEVILYRDEDFRPQNTERIFASLSSAGTFNATIALLKELDRCECTSASDLNESTILPGPYFGYGNPSFATHDSSRERESWLKPGLWVSALGKDGFWAVQAYEADNEKENGPGNKDGSTLATIKDAPVRPNVGYPRPSKPWQAVYGILVALLIGHTALLVWGSIFSLFEPLAMYAVVEGSAPYGTGDGFNDRKRRTTILALGTLFLCAGLLLLACVWNGTKQVSDLNPNWIAFAFPMACPILLGGLSFLVIWKRHREKGVAFIGVSLLLALFLCALFPRTWFPATESLLVTRRVLALTSGVSPVLPVLFLLLMGVCAFWFEMRGMALVDQRQPQLPPKTDGVELERMDEKQAGRILSAMRPLTLDIWVVVPSAVMALMLGATLGMGFGKPLQSLEGSRFDWIYGLSFWAAVVVLTGCTFKLASTWMECRVLLAALDRAPLRGAFKRLKEFSWGPLWSISGAALRESYRFLTRQLECKDRVKAGLENQFEISEEASKAIGDQIKEIEDQLGIVQKYAIDASGDGARVPEMMGAVAKLQKEMARMTGLLFRHVLRPMWSRDELPVTSVYPEALSAERSPFELVCEEYAALTYANFLVTVLLRMRTMVVCAIGMYVFLLFSLSSYPFYPSSSIFTVAVILILMLVGVIGIVYAQMHRDNTLSRLTDTTEGELGADFWLQFGSAGAIAVLTFLSSQFPDVGRVVSSFLQPLLQAIK